MRHVCFQLLIWEAQKLTHLLMLSQRKGLRWIRQIHCSKRSKDIQRTSLSYLTLEPWYLGQFISLSAWNPWFKRFQYTHHDSEINWHLENLWPSIFQSQPNAVLTVSEEFQEGLIALDMPKFLAARLQCPSALHSKWCWWVKCKLTPPCQMNSRPQVAVANKVLLQQQGPLAAPKRPWKSKAGAAAVVCVCVFAPVEIDKMLWYSIWKGCHEAVSSMIMKKLANMEFAGKIFPGKFGNTVHFLGIWPSTHHPSLFSSRSAWSLGSFLSATPPAPRGSWASWPPPGQSHEFRLLEFPFLDLTIDTKAAANDCSWSVSIINWQIGETKTNC